MPHNKELSSTCYIPNLSSHLKITNNNSLKDGIITFIPNYPFQTMMKIILFNANDTDTKCNVYDLKCSSFTTGRYEHRLSFAESNMHELILCNDIDGLIYPQKEGLYKLDLKSIDLDNGLVRFEGLDENQNEYASMGHIHGTRQLFAMQRHRDVQQALARALGGIGRTTVNKKAKCGIYDFDKAKWIDIKDFRYKLYDDTAISEFAI